MTKEDRERTRQYRERAAFEVERAASGTDPGFLQSLDMKAMLSCNSSDLVARAAQLTQKTNSTVPLPSEVVPQWCQQVMFAVIKEPGLFVAS